jgi:S-adenosylmethionine:tRNA ribosyltransferase-isomerase
MPKNQTISADYRLDSYQYNLPEEQIASRPPEQRGASRLLVLDRETGGVAHRKFRDLPELLPAKSLLIVNDSKVLPARLYGRRETGGRVEVLLLTPLPVLQVVSRDKEREAEAQVLLKASKRVKPGEVVTLQGGLVAEVLEREEFGRTRVMLRWKGDLAGIFIEHGHMPLPPYIARADDASDRDRYQTVYAAGEKLGSVASPTAGLHFTSQVQDALAGAGHETASVTLYVGYGTFSPVRSRDIREHTMHAEYAHIPRRTSQRIQQARDQGRPVVAVGTTTVRTLEGVAAAQGGPVPWRGWVNCYIYPGFRFRVVDHMVTNFHLPGSSLIIMVAAFGGRERVLATYREAVACGYRFYSYGDAMFIL